MHAAWFHGLAENSPMWPHKVATVTSVCSQKPFHSHLAKPEALHEIDSSAHMTKFIHQPCMSMHIVCSRYEDILNVLSSNLLMLDLVFVDKHHVWNESYACPRRSGTLWPGQICHLQASNTSHHVWTAASVSQRMCMTCKGPGTRCNCRGTKLTAHTMMPCMHLIRGRECFSPSRQVVQKRSRHFHSMCGWPLTPPLCSHLHIPPLLTSMCPMFAMYQWENDTNILTRIFWRAKVALSGRCEAGNQTVNFSWNLHIAATIFLRMRTHRNRIAPRHGDIPSLPWHRPIQRTVWTQYHLVLKPCRVGRIMYDDQIVWMHEQFAIFHNAPCTCMTTGYEKFLCMQETVRPFS